MFWQRPRVTFATGCWEKDWRLILLDPDYLKTKQIANHCYPFAEKLLIINNVSDLAAVKQAAQAQVDAGVLTRYIVAEESLLAPFGLNRSSFPNDWVYYNALAPLAAIHSAQSPYLLYLTGDVRLDTPVRWLDKALRFMEKKPECKVANLTWNGNYKEAKKESFKRTWNFYLSDSGFSDQMFLVRTNEFRQPIYGEIRPDSHHYPRGDVFEKRVFSYMKNRGWLRATYKSGSYIHENVPEFLSPREMKRISF